MSETAGAHHLLGRADAGEVILLVGPAYNRMREMAVQAGIEARPAPSAQDIQALKAGRSMTGRSLVLLGSAPEVEGILDRSAFGPLTELAYDVDRVVYSNEHGAVLLHPLPPGTHIRVHGGSIEVRQEITAAPTPSEETSALMAGSL